MKQTKLIQKKRKKLIRIYEFRNSCSNTMLAMEYFVKKELETEKR